MCEFVLAEVNSIEEGLLNIYIAFEAAEGASNSNRVCIPTCVSHMLFHLKVRKGCALPWYAENVMFVEHAALYHAILNT